MNPTIMTTYRNFAQQFVSEDDLSKIRVFPVAQQLVVFSFGGPSKHVLRDKFCETVDRKYVAVEKMDVNGYPAVAVTTRGWTN